jgi:hypothetical protein
MLELQKEYHSIDDLMDNESDTLRDILNDQDLYCGLVKALGYRRITIGVERNGELYKCWTSINDEEGKIEKIEEGHLTTDIPRENLYTTIDEKDLLAVANDYEGIKNNVLASIIKYAPKFKMNKDIRNAIVRGATNKEAIKLGTAAILTGFGRRLRLFRFRNS